MGNKLFVVGIGPGDSELIHPTARKIIENSDVLIGGKRNLKVFSKFEKESLIIGNNLEEIYSYITENIDKKNITVLATGDPGIYSIMEFLNERVKNVEIEVVPGISSLQYLCSKLKLSWDDIYITSVHGREQPDLIGVILNNKKVAIFTGGKYTPDYICRKLSEDGLEDILVSVGENLSYPDERIVSGSLQDIANITFGSLSIMIIKHEKQFEKSKNEWRYVTSGMPDDMFVRGEVPMTKEEVRAVGLSKLRLTANDIVFDIGAGTGSVSVECALMCNRGEVFAIERNIEAIKLIQQNARKFNLKNLSVINGECPDALEGLPQPDRVFIGGTGGSMSSILDLISKMKKEIRVVINSVTIESTSQAIENLKQKGFSDIDIINVSVSRSREVGGKHLMQALNPIYIISANKY